MSANDPKPNDFNGWAFSQQMLRTTRDDPHDYEFRDPKRSDVVCESPDDDDFWDVAFGLKDRN